MERATIDRIQRMIDEETTELFPADAAPRPTLLHYGDHPEIEPGELYLQVILDQDGPAWNAWTQEQRDRIWDFRDQRLPEAKGVMVTTGTPDTAGRRPTSIMKVAVSLLDPQEDELARGLTPVMARLGPVDLATLDALITAGIAASRAEAARWALARIREQPACANLSERAREPAGPQARAGLDRAARDQLQSRLNEQVKEHFPDDGVQRVALLQYGDDPWVEPGDLLVRVFTQGYEEEPHLPTWVQDREAMLRELRRELAEKLPGAMYLEFWFGENERQCHIRQKLSCPPKDLARREHDLTPVDVRLGPADLEMLDTLISTGAAASRAEAIGWVLARIRERPAYARLSERVRELAELKVRF